MDTVGKLLYNKQIQERKHRVWFPSSVLNIPFFPESHLNELNSTACYVVSALTGFYVCLIQQHTVTDVNDLGYCGSQGFYFLLTCLCSYCVEIPVSNSPYSITKYTPFNSPYSITKYTPFNSS